MLKFGLKKEQLNFTQGWLTPETDMIVELENGGDLLAALLVGMNMEDAVDRIIS